MFKKLIMAGTLAATAALAAIGSAQAGVYFPYNPTDLKIATINAQIDGYDGVAIHNVHYKPHHHVHKPRPPKPHWQHKPHRPHWNHRPYRPHNPGWHRPHRPHYYGLTNREIRWKLRRQGLFNIRFAGRHRGVVFVIANNHRGYVARYKVSRRTGHIINSRILRYTNYNYNNGYARY